MPLETEHHDLAFFTFPKFCLNVPQGRCEILRERMESDLRRDFGGFSATECRGEWNDEHGNPVRDENYCYIVGKKATPAAAKKLEMTVLQAARKAGEHAVSIQQNGVLHIQFTRQSTKRGRTLIKTRQERVV